MLTLNNVEVIYNDIILVLKGMSMHVPEGQIVGLLGSNGAGKSTTLKAISGLLKPEDGEVTDGSIEYRGEAIHHRDAEDIVRMGIFQVMEGRRVFEHLTVEENLIAGGYTRSDPGGVRKDMQMVYEYFPRLKERRTQVAGYLSGGEQQMLAIGRALMAKPHLMMLDEPSLGLAPILVREIFDIVARINAEHGATILLVEQNANLTLSVAHYAYIMENGRIVLEGTPAELRENADVREFYLGLTEVGQRKSYREVKHYKRRKRWLS
ncbi:MAG: ABC transporter ATP-binding protein [Anaerolineae bacterium]|nr:MAG: ABC transporter ATP-binding protein [Anaerolineae bacterium]